MNAFDSVRSFEAAIAEYSGSKYAVAVDSCSNALFLCCLRANIKGQTVCIPKHTYISVPCAIIHAGGKVVFNDISWSGMYQLKPFSIWDGAKRFTRNMYVKDSFHCLSFHMKKHLPLGRGGAILTDDKDAYDWFKLMRFDGREECGLNDQKEFTVLGWNFYMSPDIASRGLWLMNTIKDHNADLEEVPQYPDLSKIKIFLGNNE